jgi:hypothetical protein
MWPVALWKRGNVPEVPVARIFSFKMGGVGFSETSLISTEVR